MWRVTFKVVLSKAIDCPANQFEKSFVDYMGLSPLKVEAFVKVTATKSYVVDTFNFSDAVVDARKLFYKECSDLKDKGLDLYSIEKIRGCLASNAM